MRHAYGVRRRATLVDAEVELDRERVRRYGAMAVVATFALVVLAACGSGAGEEAAHEQVTRVPVMSDAAAQATREAASGATPGAGARPVKRRWR